jgi:uncharacterized protein YjiK
MIRWQRLAGKITTRLVLAGLAWLATNPTTIHAAELYAVESGSASIHVIDLATGAATLVNPVGVNDIAGIAFDSSGVLYGITNSPNEALLYTIDFIGGTASLVNPTAIASPEGALTFHPDTDVLYSKGGAPASENDLVSIDPGTGLGTIIGPMGLGFDLDLSGMDFLADGTLLAYDTQGSLLPSRLLSIDTTSGAATVIGSTGSPSSSPDFGGLAVDPDTDLVYLSNGTHLFGVDPTTGAASLIGPHGTTAPLSGLSFRETSCMLGLEITQTSDGFLWDIDPVTGAGSNPRPLGSNGFGALAQSPTGELYAIRFLATADFYQIDPITGATTLIGPMGASDIEGGLDFDPTTGILYGVNAGGGVTGGLFTVDLGTGAMAIVGPILDTGGGVIDASAMAFDESGDLYLLRTEAIPMELWQIDPSDASTLSVTPIPGLAMSSTLAIGGMEFDDSSGKLYVLYEGGGALAEVDPITGASTILGPTPANAGLEIVAPCGPPPSGFIVPSSSLPSLAMLAAAMLGTGLSGGLGLTLLRRNQRSSFSR